jgi:hypothetical protein
MADLQQETLSAHIMSMLNDGLGRETVTKELISKGHDEQYVTELVGELAKLRNAKRRSQGLTLILCGAVVCFASFLLTITSSFSQGSFPIVLYGLTSLGILIVFAGFMKVF